MKIIIATMLCLLMAITATAKTQQEEMDAALSAYQKNDYATAINIFKKLAEQGDVIAQFNLGMIYEYGRGVPQDYQEAFQWFLKAAEQGDAQSQRLVADMYHFGKGVPLDYKESAKWGTKAAEHGVIESKFDRGERIGILPIGKLADSVEEVIKAFEFAQRDRYYKWACNILISHIEMNNKRIHTRIYGAMSRNNCEPQDIKFAVNWYERKTADGDALATLALGTLYRTGKGVPNDDKKALRLYHVAAEKGLFEAQSLLGLLYIYGERIDKNYQEAIKWYRKAADQGDPGIQTLLGSHYADGEFVPQDYQEAVKWYRMAAVQEDHTAQFLLGQAYHEGRGVPQNKVIAHMWVNLSAAQGNSKAIPFLNIIEKDMTAKQLEEAQRLAREWNPKK